MLADAGAPAVLHLFLSQLAVHFLRALGCALTRCLCVTVSPPACRLPSTTTSSPSALPWTSSSSVADAGMALWARPGHAGTAEKINCRDDVI